MVYFLFIIFVSIFITIIDLKSPDFVCFQIFFLVLSSVYKTHWEASLFKAPEGLCIKKTLCGFESWKEPGYKTA